MLRRLPRLTKRVPVSQVFRPLLQCRAKFFNTKSGDHPQKVNLNFLDTKDAKKDYEKGVNHFIRGENHTGFLFWDLAFGPGKMIAKNQAYFEKILNRCKEFNIILTEDHFALLASKYYFCREFWFALEALTSQKCSIETNQKVFETLMSHLDYVDKFAYFSKILHYKNFPGLNSEYGFSEWKLMFEVLLQNPNFLQSVAAEIDVHKKRDKNFIISAKWLNDFLNQEKKLAELLNSTRLETKPDEETELIKNRPGRPR